MRPRLPLVVVLLVLSPATALAQDEAPEAPAAEDGVAALEAGAEQPADAPAARAQQVEEPEQEPGPEPDPAGGRATFGTASGLRVDGRRYVMRTQKVFLRGSVTPLVADQQVTVEVRRNGRLVETVRRPITGSGETGHFNARFVPRRTGRYSFQAVHAGNDRQGAFRSRTVAVKVVSPSAGQGARGVRVELLHKGLRKLAFVAPSGSRFTDATARAVIAFRKTNGMRRVGRADRGVYSKLLRGRGGFELRHDHRGRYVEFDISRQVLVLARNGKARRIYHSSSGKPSTPTVLGTFRFYRKDRGTNSLGMVHSLYFHHGYAIHGYRSVPTYPASHGCLRVPIPNALSIYRWVDLGDRIHVYR